MKSPDENQYLEKFELYVLGLRTGIVEVKELIEFADEVIANNTNSDFIFIEISLSGSDKTSLLDILKKHIKEQNTTVKSKYLFGEICHSYLRQKISTKNVIDLLYNMIGENYLNKNELNHLYYLTDAFDLVSTEISQQSLGQYKSELRDFLKFYEDYHLFKRIVWIN